MRRTFAAAVVLGTMAFGVGPTMADMGQPEARVIRGIFCRVAGAGLGLWR